MILKTDKDLKEYVENLKINNISFNLVQSSSRITVIRGDFKATYYPNKLGKKNGLYFIKKVKDYILKNNIEYNFNLKINYNKLNKKLILNKWYSKDLYEIDLKGAYWEFFYKNGFCSRELYLEGLKVDKKTRLMSLGALAKQTTTFEYENGEVKSINTDKSEATNGLFFKVAYDTGVVMSNLMKLLKTDDLYFFWVDAIFFKGKKNKELIEKELKKLDLKYKIVPIKKLIRHENTVIVEDFDYKQRVFNFIKTTKRII